MYLALLVKNPDVPNLNRTYTFSKPSKSCEKTVKYFLKKTLSYLGIQLGGVRSTSQVAKSFMGTGLKFDVTLEDNNPAILKLAPIFVPEMAELEATAEIEEVAAVEPGFMTED